MAERPDFLLWLNDDVTLAQGALDRMVTTANSSDGSVVVGGLVDPVTAEVTYSGVLLSRWHPLRVRLVHPTDQPLEADTFNGNVVLVPRSVYERVGPIDGAFAHGQADFDYGLRARRAGFRVLVAPAPVGTCPRGGTEGTFYDTSLPLKERWDLMQRPTGLPMGSHARYLQRHGGPLWPVFWAAPYAKLLLSGLVAMATGHARRPKRRGQGQA